MKGAINNARHFPINKKYCEKYQYYKSVSAVLKRVFKCKFIANQSGLFCIMHEVSLVKNIFSILEDEFSDKMGKLQGIHLTVGLLSNVQPVLMQNAFEAVKATENSYNKVSLHIEVLPILVHCDECNTTSEIKNSRFVCTCGKPARNIIQGEELFISKLEYTEE